MRSALPFMAGILVGLAWQRGGRQPRDAAMLNHIALGARRIHA